MKLIGITDTHKYLIADNLKFKDLDSMIQHRRTVYEHIIADDNLLEGL